MMTLRELRDAFVESREFYVGMGWNRSNASIGLFDGQLMIASDIGSVVYRDMGEGGFQRNENGYREKLIEFMETDLEWRIAAHNQACRDRKMLAGV